MKNLTLLSLVNLAIKHIVLIIAVAVIFAAGAFSYCEFIAEPQYSAKGSILITNGSVFTDEAGNTWKKGMQRSFQGKQGFSFW